MKSLLPWAGADQRPYKYNECANSTSGTQQSDFQTFCCDGDIRDTARSMWLFPGGLFNYLSAWQKKPTLTVNYSPERQTRRAIPCASS